MLAGEIKRQSENNINFNQKMNKIENQFVDNMKAKENEIGEK